jgi:putative N6-adenine-specific DNA methylase
MQGVAITNPGAENVCALEINELIKIKKTIKEDSIVKFRFSKYDDLARIAYRSQSISRIILLLHEFEVVNNLENTLKRIPIDKIDLSWITSSFKVEAKRIGEHEFNSVDIATEISKKILKITKKKIDYDSPVVIYYLYIYHNKGYLGIDFCGFDLSKRQYKIFNHPESLKGITGYVLVRESGYTSSKLIIDPFMGSGVIPIEAGLYAQEFPVQYYNKDKFIFSEYNFFKESFFKKEDANIKESKPRVYGYDHQLRYLKAAQKNAKLAGININLSKIDIEWLDTKFNRNTVDAIITDPPRMSKHKDLKKLKKTYNELFYQANYVLKKKGSIVLLAKDFELLKEAAKKHKFKLKKFYPLNQGKEVFNVVIFENG